MAHHGLTLYAISRDLVTRFQTLFDYILQVDPNHLTATPSFASICLQDQRFCHRCLPGLCCLDVGGENLPPTIGLELLQRFPGIYMCNGYGTTETCVGAIIGRIEPDMFAPGQPVRIGELDFESEAFVVDSLGHEVPDGQTGELLLVSLGYVGNPELNQQKFFVTPDGRRGFFTGDLVFREKGSYYYVGRKDNLVKVGGYRVELEEVEQQLSTVSRVRDCAVVPITRDGQVILLAAYITVKRLTLPKWRTFWR